MNQTGRPGRRCRYVVKCHHTVLRGSMYCSRHAGTKCTEHGLMLEPVLSEYVEGVQTRILFRVCQTGCRVTS